jgi:hypothetical protein
MDLFYVKLSYRGTRKALLLCAGVPAAETHALLQSAFALAPDQAIAGLLDVKNQVIYPLSSVCARPEQFRSEYSFVLKTGTFFLSLVVRSPQALVTRSSVHRCV